MKKILFTIVLKPKYLGINLTKEYETLYSKKNETLLKEIKEDLNKWKDVSILLSIERLNIINDLLPVQYPPKSQWLFG